MRFLLDTSAYSAFMRGHAKIRSAVQSNEEIFLSSVIVGELIAGFILPPQIMVDYFPVA